MRDFLLKRGEMVQYCTKCNNLVEDKITVCPHCKRSRALREAQDDDMLFMMKVSEYEAGELSEMFETQAVKYEVKPIKTSMVSSVYDSEYIPTDKNIFVAFKDVERAKKILEEEIIEKDIEEIEEGAPSPKRIALQIVSVLLFLLLVSATVLFADAIANYVRNLFY